MSALNVQRALKAGDETALGGYIEDLARLLMTEAERMKSNAPEATAILDDASRALAFLGAAINPPANSKGWRLTLKRNGPGKPAERLQITNFKAWSTARTLARVMKSEGKRWRAFEILKEKYGISESQARRAEKRVQYWMANQDKADGVEIPFVAKEIQKPAHDR